MTDQYQYWRDALAGKKPPIHDGDAQIGFYRKRNKPRDGQPVADDPVAIFNDGGSLVAIVGPQNRSRVCDPNEIWTWVADKPVKYDGEGGYKAAFENNAWDKAVAGLGDQAPRGMGDNNPPADPFETMKAEIENAMQLAEQALSADIKSQEQADRIANIKDRFLNLQKEADKARIAEKKPHDEAAAEVQKKWKPLVDAAASMKSKLVNRINDWIRTEEQRLAREQLEAAKKAEAAGEELPTGTAEPVRIGGGVSGRKTSMRSRKIATIEDPVAFATFLLADGKQPNPDVMDTLQRCANRIASAGGKAPGISIKTERKAA